IDLAHINRARQPDARAGGGARDAVLAGTRLGDDAPGAESARQQRLTERVIDLVGAGVREILAREPDLGAPALRQVRRRAERRRAADPVAQLALELRLELGIGEPAARAALQ